MFYMKTKSVRMYTHFITVKITSKFRMTSRLYSKLSVISRFLKYKLCPPPFFSRVLLSWQLVDPFLYESTRIKIVVGIYTINVKLVSCLIN